MVREAWDSARFPNKSISSRFDLLSGSCVYRNGEPRQASATNPIRVRFMNSKLRVRIAVPSLSALAFAMVLCTALWSSAQGTGRILGTIAAINGNTLTVKTDTGEQREVEVPVDASIKRTEPGQKDLSSAATITFADLATGDRVLVKLDPNATASTAQASLVVAIKQADVARKQQQDRDEWQKHGIAGLVKSVDAGTGAITVTTGAGPTAKTVTVATTKTTSLKRYASGSVRFADAQPAPLDAIHSGDQLRARGERNADGTVMAAAEVVSGTFRHIAGTVASIDVSGSALIVKDLATKKQVTINIDSDAQMHRIPEQMARMLAARLKGTPPQGMPAGMPAGGAMSGSGTTGGSQAGHATPGQSPHGNGPGGPGGPPGGGDPQRMLSMTPAIKLSDLQKGEAVMVVATDGTSDVNAVTLLAGVEPLLEAPAASNLLSNWSMGGGGEGAGAGPQ